MPAQRPSRSPAWAVRVPLNEACWNGESYVNSDYAGANYISAVSAYVNLLNSNGIVVPRDLLPGGRNAGDG